MLLIMEMFALLQLSLCVCVKVNQGGGKGPLLSENRSLTIATNNDQTMFIFYGNRVADIRIQDDKINTLQARMGTGGNNMPMVASIQNTVIGRSDTAGPQGKGYADDGEPMFTLDTTSPHAVTSNTVVRRLTPIECERLQGFPDNWTDGQTDTHRYKQMGNAVAVPVVEWLVGNLVENC